MPADTPAQTGPASTGAETLASATVPTASELAGGATPLLAAFQAKLDEQIERAVHLIALLPDDRVEWQPPMAGSWPPSILLGHLLECLAGFCAVLCAVEPERLRDLAELRELPVNHRCGKTEARDRMAVYQARIHEGFGLLDDGRLGQQVATIFAGEGEKLLTLLLGNLEHLINHKHQLFTYLKLMGVEVSTRDLYRFRGE